VLAAISSSKFSSSSLNPVFDDELDTPKFEDQDSSTSAAVACVLDSLEEIHALTDCSKNDQQLLDGLLDSTSLHEMLNLYEKIRNTTRPSTTPPSDNLNVLQSLIQLQESCDDPDFIELITILSKPHLTAALQTHDVIAHEFLTTDPVTTSNNGFTDQQPDEQSIEDSDNPAVDSSEVTRVRLVQFMKNTEEPLGITLKLSDEGRCIVARIIHGGMIHRQGTLQVGDEIREINGVKVADNTIDTLQRMLKEARGSLTFKIVPSYKPPAATCEIYVRAQFDYDPLSDDLIPCKEAGISFKIGDILQVISKDDQNWWQARVINHGPGRYGPAAGLVPSPEFQQWRVACLAVERAKEHQNANNSWFGRKKKNPKDKMLLKSQTGDLLEQLDLVTYEVVVKKTDYTRKTLVLIG